MSVDWGDWSPYQGAVGRPLSEVDRKTAQAYFDDLMAARPARAEQLERLLERNGVEPGRDDAGIQRLDDWFRANVEPNETESHRLTPRWHAVALDIGLFLGDTMIDRAPNLEWRMLTGNRREFSYQRPVIMGFQNVKDRKYNIDPELFVGDHGIRVATGLDEPDDRFLQVLRWTLEYA